MQIVAFRKKEDDFLKLIFFLLHIVFWRFFLTKMGYYYGIRPLCVGLLVNFHIFNKGWPCSIVEGIRVGILMILQLNLAKSNIIWSCLKRFTDQFYEILKIVPIMGRREGA